MAYKIVVLKVDDVFRGGMTEAVTEGAEAIDSALSDGYTVAFTAVGEKYTLVYLHQMPDTDMLGNPLDAADVGFSHLFRPDFQAMMDNVFGGLPEAD